MKRVHLIISGDVVGVGFRAWMLRHAEQLRLTGWVKNREDEAVETVAEGTNEALAAFIALAHKGPDVSWVEHVDETWGEATGEFDGFFVV